MPENIYDYVCDYQSATGSALLFLPCALYFLVFTLLLAHFADIYRLIAEVHDLGDRQRPEY